MRLSRRTAFTGLALVALLIIGIATVIGASAAADPVSISITTATEGNVTIYRIAAKNNTGDNIGQFEVIAGLPGGKFVFASVGYKLMGSNISWISTKALGPGKTFPAEFKVQDASGVASATINYRGIKGTGSATAQSGATAAPAAAEKPQAAATPEPPRRGCQACHVLVDKATGKYTLAWEAEERVKADYPGQEHPTMAPDGTSIKPTDQTGPGPCLQCHAPGTGARAGKGNIAPLALRDIVHPAHMFSAPFKDVYKGNCFTCHNVDGMGNFVLLGEQVDVNEKGVPKALLKGTGNIPGQIAPSEGKN